MVDPLVLKRFFLFKAIKKPKTDFPYVWSKVEFDRRTVDIIKEYENKTQMLLKQIQLQNTHNEADKNGAASKDNHGDVSSSDVKAGGGSSSNLSAGVLEVKVKELERELYYYKSTCRDLKRKMREMASSGGGPNTKQSPLQSASGVNNEVNSSVNSKYVPTPRGPQSNSDLQSARLIIIIINLFI